MKHITANKFQWLYMSGIFIILALPILTLSPWFYPADWGKTILFRSIMAIMLFLLTWQFLFKKQVLRLPDIKKNPVAWCLTALGGIYFLASIFSVDPYFSFWGSPIRSGGFVTFAFYIVFAIFVFFIAKQSDWKKFWDFSIFIGILVSLVAIIQYYGLFSTWIYSADQRPSSTIGNPIFLGVYLLLLFFITLVFLLKEKNVAYKIFYGVSLLLFSYVILISGSRAAYLGVLIGVIYFLLLYPKKLFRLKIIVLALLIVSAGIIYYTNTQKAPALLANNRLYESIAPRLSIKAFLSDDRFPAWVVGTQAFLQKPILGYGPENFYVGFDKYYNPVIGDEWWDRAHNIFIQTANDAGILGLIAYVGLFIVLFICLQKVKKNSSKAPEKDPQKPQGQQEYLIAHGIQATLLAYIVANTFSIDSFPTYLLFFLFIGYTLHLMYANKPSTNTSAQKSYQPKKTLSNIIITCLLILLIVFLWQYNILPSTINAKINEAEGLSDNKGCDQALSLMDSGLSNHTFLDSYARLKDVEFLKTCASFYPANNLVYANKGVALLKEAAAIQPLYVRTWIYLGAFNTVLAVNQNDAATKSALLAEAYGDFKKADQLAPSHEEMLYEESKADLVAGNYQAMSTHAESCISLYQYPDCYWIQALSDIYLNNGNWPQDLQKAESEGADLTSNSYLYDLVNAYAYTKNYAQLVLVYQQLIINAPNVAPYHSSLAFAYSKLGQYDNARSQAMIFLQLMPTAKDEVQAFLQSLPQQ